MKDLLIRAAKVIDPNGPHHNETIDILIKNGKIASIGKRLKQGDAKVLRSDALHVSPGWVDTRAHLRDPGEEYKEDIISGLNAAAAGGFTVIAALPSTSPPIDSRADIQYVKQRSEGHAVKLLPMGCISKDGAGKQLAEMHDMQQSGAVAFTDDRPVDNTRLMMLAMQYANDINSKLITSANDDKLSVGGQMHEGVTSTILGMRGIAPIAEEVRLMRDLALLEYTGSSLHVATISTTRSVELIREAKAKKLNVTASVAAHNLLLDDSQLDTFDALYKVMPPLRDQAHIDALRQGAKDGTIDNICSDHRPEDVEHKDLEFAQAAFGILGLQTSFAAANTALKTTMSTLRIVERFCHGPRKVLGLEVPHIKKDAIANLTLFDPEEVWTLEKADVLSKSKNTPFVGHSFTGKPLGVVANGKVVLCAQAGVLA